MEPEEKKSIKECLELVAGVTILGVAAKKIAADGKVNMADAPIVLDLVKDINPIVEAFKGLDQVDDEVKDLDEQELIQLGLAVFNSYKSIKSA